MQLSPRYDGPAILSIDGPPPAALEPTVRQRRRFAATLAELSDEQWATPSRCEGWTVQDVVAHLATVNSFWQLSVQSGLSGAPTRYLATFDPAATPAAMVDGMRALAPAEVLDQFVTSNDGFLAALADLDDAGWTTLAEAPPGHLPISRLADHALWDCWVHERDVALPLGQTPVVEADEVVASLRYAAALSPAFALSTDDAVPDVYAVAATDPEVAFVLEVGTSVSVRMGPAPEGAPMLEGPGVDLLEALSMRTPLPASAPVEWQLMLGGLASAFDLEVERPIG